MINSELLSLTWTAGGSTKVQLLPSTFLAVYASACEQPVIDIQPGFATKVASKQTVRSALQVHELNA